VKFSPDLSIVRSKRRKTSTFLVKIELNASKMMSFYYNFIPSGMVVSNPDPYLAFQVIADPDPDKLKGF